LTWLSGAAPATSLDGLQARIRHRQALQNCRLQSLHDDTCELEFEQPQRAIAPGQSVALYWRDECLGGGIIDSGFD
jgi:tRNA-specific 2-thiouridylase